MNPWLLACIARMVVAVLVMVALYITLSDDDDPYTDELCDVTAPDVDYIGDSLPGYDDLDDDEPPRNAE